MVSFLIISLQRKELFTLYARKKRPKIVAFLYSEEKPRNLVCQNVVFFVLIWGVTYVKWGGKGNKLRGDEPQNAPL